MGGSRSTQPVARFGAVPLAVVSPLFGLLGILTSVWIPTLALLLGVVGAGLGALAMKYSTGKTRSVALAGLALGVLAIVTVMAVVLITSGSSNGTSFTQGGGVS